MTEDRKVSPYDDPRWGPLRRKRMKLARETNEPCVRCHRPIDYGLSGRARWGPTCDHLEPLGVGGDIAPDIEGLAPSHNACNARHGSRLGARMAGKKVGSTNPPRVMSPPVRPPSSSSSSSSAPVDWGRLQGNVNLASMPFDAAPPRLFSPKHPRAVGTYGSILLPWIRERMAEEGPDQLRWFQELILDRAWEHDADGRLVWRQVVVSTPRQVGKTYMTREHALARCSHPELFGEPQIVLHSSRTLTNATNVHSTAWTWAADQGLSLLRRFGSERIGWADGSKWMVSSLDAIYGHSGSVATVDEAWSCDPKVITAGVLPVLASRRSSQLWLLSTANSQCTELMPRKRVEASRAGSNVMLAEWSADPSADPLDLASYRSASPHWDENRVETIEQVMGEDDAREQFLNVWPESDGEGELGWPPGWDACGAVEGPPPAGAVAALELDLEHKSAGLAVAFANGAQVALWTRVVGDLEEAVQQLLVWRPRLVLVGASMFDQVYRRGGPWQLERAGASETKTASPGLLAAVRDRRVVHDHDPKTAAQVQGAVAIATETGPMLSGRRSKTPVAAIKAAAWAYQAALDGAAPESPAVF